MDIFKPQAKVIANADYVSLLLGRGSCPPILVEVDPSNACNHGCDFCLSSYVHSDRKMLDKETLLRLCRDLNAVGAKAINWTGGGEPTTNPHLQDAIRFIGENTNVKMGLFTNGTLLDRPGLLYAIVKHLTWIRISVDAGTPETYNRIRHTGGQFGWDKMLANLDLLIQANWSGLDIGVGFVVTPSNVQDVLEFARLFKDRDVAYCQFKPEIVNIERENGSQRRVNFWKLTQSRLAQAREILGDKFQLNDYKLDDLTANTAHYGRTYRKCLGSQLSPCVGADGCVYVCPNLRGKPQYSYGSIHERSFVDIWNDMGRRREVMDRIENQERFAFCTKLCKPHESNKILWQLYSDYNAAADKPAFLEHLAEQQKTVSVHHPEFI